MATQFRLNTSLKVGKVVAFIYNGRPTSGEVMFVGKKRVILKNKNRKGDDQRAFRSYSRKKINAAVTA